MHEVPREGGEGLSPPNDKAKTVPKGAIEGPDGVGRPEAADRDADRPLEARAERDFIREPSEPEPPSRNLWTKLVTPFVGPYRDLHLREQARKERKRQEAAKGGIQPEPESGIRATLRRVVRTVWESARGPAIAQGVANVVETAAALGSFYIGAKLFRGFETIYQGGAIDGDLKKNLIIAAGLGLVGFAKPISNYLSEAIRTRMELRTQKDVMTAIASRRQSELEQASLGKEIASVRENAGWAIPNLAQGMIQSASRSVEMVFAGGLLGYVSLETLGVQTTATLGAALILATVPRLLGEHRHARDTLLSEEDIADTRRKSWFRGWAVTDNKHVREVKGLGREATMRERALEALTETRQAYLDPGRRNIGQQVFAQVVGKGASLGCLGVFVVQALKGQMAPEMLGVAVGAVTRFEYALSGISEIVGQQLRNLEFARKAVSMYEAGERVLAAETARRTVSLDPEGPTLPIEFVGVSYTYPGASYPAVDNLSVRFVPGELVAIVGPNGCGKTTTAKLLRGIYPADEGVVLFGKHDVETINYLDLVSYVASVGQDSILFPAMSLEESIRLGEPAERKGLDFEEALRLGLTVTQLHKFKAGLQTVVGSGFEGGQDLSSGQTQMALASRTFLRDPRIMVLDEAGSNLDPEKDAELTRNLESFGSDGHCTRVLITHNLKCAARLADRIIVMNDGRIEAQGTHDELMEANAWYQHAYGQQLEKESVKGRPS